MFKKQSIFRFNLFFHQSIRIPKTIQAVRLQAIQTIQTIQTLYHPLAPVERAVFSVKSVLGINIFWVKKG